MSQKIFNGFPQYFSYTYLVGKFFGNTTTQAQESHTDINLQNELVGDILTMENNEVGLLTVIRDGATLIDDQGWELISPNTIRIWPGLLSTETLQFKKLVGVSGIIEAIPSVPPTSNPSGYPTEIIEATVYTDNFKPSINAFSAITLAGKTRISTQFLLDEGRVDVYINSTRVSLNDGIWIMADNTTIELDDDYSATRMKVDIIRQKVG